MTADPNALRALADRVEKAAKGDRGLDLEIVCEVGPPNSVDGWCPPRFTFSLDAAVALVPNLWCVLMAWGGRDCVCDVHTKPIGHPQGKWPGHAKAATPALALTAAALRALAAMLEGGE